MAFGYVGVVDAAKPVANLSNSFHGLWWQFLYVISTKGFGGKEDWQREAEGAAQGEVARRFLGAVLGVSRNSLGVAS